MGSTNRRITVQAGLGIKQDPISKIINAERAGGVIQVVELLPSKHKTLISTFSTTKKKKRIGYTILDIM
jgi:hypothetical protein